MKKNTLVCPKASQIMNEEQLNQVNGGVSILVLVSTIASIAYGYGYPQAGIYAKQNIWKNGKIPLAAKIALMATFPDPIGWVQFMNAFNAA